MLTISKRIRFLISSIVLIGGFISIQFLDNQYRFTAIVLLSLITGLFSTWSFYEGLGLDMTLSSFILPILFTLGVGIFWFLLPVSIYTRIPIIIFFAIGIYVLFSTMNIYTVSSSKTIALLRAARGVGFVLTLVTSFLLFDAILSIRQAALISAPLIFISSFLFFLQGFWSIELGKKIDRNIINMTIISSLIVTELGIIIFFWPVTVVVGSLFLTSGVYMLLGLGQTKLEDRLFPSAIREYITVGFIVLIGMFFATHWGG
ncbi:MAG: hypothetical protein ACD_19C00176G0080 [uncultured bacterium]|nr:MAG: hypothetical protein ACD_19C00176G0080 [uncultured bacterium]